jgi:hypothetical protein
MMHRQFVNMLLIHPPLAHLFRLRLRLHGRIAREGHRPRWCERLASRAQLASHRCRTKTARGSNGCSPVRGRLVAGKCHRRPRRQ